MWTLLKYKQSSHYGVIVTAAAHTAVVQEQAATMIEEGVIRRVYPLYVTYGKSAARTLQFIVHIVLYEGIRGYG